jgi:hypothetical protein
LSLYVKPIAGISTSGGSWCISLNW